MKSTVASAVLGAAILTQAASIGHGHAHVHRRAPTPAAAPAKRAVQFISPQDISRVTSMGFKVGINAPCEDETAGAVTVGQTGGSYVAEFNNDSDEDIVLLVWSNKAGEPIPSIFINAVQPDVSHTLRAGTQTWVSFDTAKGINGAISGGWGALYKDTPPALSGQLNNTITEYTFTNPSWWSTTDVSSLVNMNGHNLTIHNYPSKDAADNDDVAPSCVSSKTACSYQCKDTRLATCYEPDTYTLANCAVGAGTTANKAATDGGCSGMGDNGGYIKVYFN